MYLLSLNIQFCSFDTDTYKLYIVGIKHLKRIFSM